ncbi:metallophosphoesterase [Luxibacter massiliensis]|uniref:metallophosphoesterase n=1 Tax=Luxibacter massiliensis TaxID=2219695 RepID=UPI000F054637|nr:metallophosphoesterase [Luxibacter massiliensis]
MIKGILAVLLGLAAVFLAESKRELGFFKITRYSLSVPKLKALDSEKKILLLADLHNKTYGDNNERLLQAVKEEHPDLILIAGDMLIGKEEPAYENGLNFVSMLPSICPVYYSLGNHEQRMKEMPQKYGGAAFREYKARLLGAGVHMLENEKAEIMLDRLRVQIYGLELPLYTYKKFKRHTVAPGDIQKCIGRAHRDKFQILLAHNPVYFPAYRGWGADLTVSGHLHGGIIRIPGLGGIITPQAILFPKYSGEMTVEDGQAIAVSRGLGTHTVNMRFCNYAEVVAITLRPYKTLVHS